MRWFKLAWSMVWIAGAARLAAADANPECNYLEIAASTASSASVDPDLKPLEKKLKKPPFASWNAFHKLSGGALVLVKLRPEALMLARGAATVVLRDRNDKRIEIAIAIDSSEGTRVLDTKQSVALGDWSVWVHNVKDEGHIVALTCK